jgi:hypothetical protein
VSATMSVFVTVGRLKIRSRLAGTFAPVRFAGQGPAQPQC